MPRQSRKPALPRLALPAEVRVKAAGGGGSAPFEIVAYTGEPLRLAGIDLPVVVDCATLNTSAQSLPALYDHDQHGLSVVGQIESVRVAGPDGTPPIVAAGYFTPTDEPGDAATFVMKKHAAGFRWQASIGGDPAGPMQRVAPGETVAVNGREYTGPLYVARGVELKEISFVVIGADRRTRVAARNSEGSIMASFEEWVATMTALFSGGELDEGKTAAAKVIYDSLAMPATEPAAETPAEPVAAAEGETPEEEEEEEPMAARAQKPAIQARNNRPDPIAKLRKDSADEITRQGAIQEIAARYSNPTIKVGSRTVPLAAHAIAQNWTREKTELEALRNDRPSGPHLHVATGGPALQGAAGNSIIEAALCTALGQRDLEKNFKPEILEAAHSRFRGRVSLQQVMILAASQNGYAAGAGERIHAGNIREVLGYAFPRLRASGASTVSLPGIFGNVANKELLTGYMEEDQSWREVSAIKSVPDFKSITSYRLLDNMAYEQVGADGKIKHGSVSEESYTRQANTYAKMFTLTRRDIINDDLGAFNDLRNRLGRGAAQKFNDVFWTEFLSDHSTFFTTARTNYITGATTTLLTDGVGLGLAVKAFRQMTSPSADGTKRIGGTPEILLVPPELEQAAEALYVNQNLGAVATSSANIYANKYRPVTVAWLSDSAFTGYSTTAWYLLRSPGVMPMVVASFLNGMEAPTVEDSDADFDTLGVQFRGYHDFGCDQAEYLCGIKSKGAA